jgi:hypothetical protein
VPSSKGVRADFTKRWPATYRAALLLTEFDSISLIGPKHPEIGQQVILDPLNERGRIFF